MLSKFLVTSTFVFAVAMHFFGFYNKPEQTGQKFLKESANHIATTSKVVALTFDADMTPFMLRQLKSGKVKSWYNKDVIDLLQQTNTPATLFLTGLWIETYPTTTQVLSENPLFELGNHSYSHGSFAGNCYGLRHIPNSKDSLEVAKTESLLLRYADHHVKFFRFPGLCFDKESIKRVESTGYRIINGDVVSGDGFQKNPKVIVNNVMRKVRPGSIVIMHMHGGKDAPKTAEALSEIIRELSDKGYSFVKVSDLEN
jgi:peptidoglycan/xylan/chitin deacetylase (PgdA/CDA1 family)